MPHMDTLAYPLLHVFLPRQAPYFCASQILSVVLIVSFMARGNLGIISVPGSGVRTIELLTPRAQPSTAERNGEMPEVTILGTNRLQ